MAKIWTPSTATRHKQRGLEKSAEEDDDAPPCPQLVEPGIDFLSHVLLQRLSSEGCLVVGIRQAAVALLQATQPIVLMLTTDSCSLANGVVLSNLASVACLLGVPVVYTLSRRHMGEACGAPCAIGAVAVMNAPQDSKVILAAILERAAKAWREFETRLLAAPATSTSASACFETTGETGEPATAGC